MMNIIPSRGLFLMLSAIISIYAIGQAKDAASSGQKAGATTPYKLCWDYRFESAPVRSIASSNEAIFVAEPGGRIRAISPNSNQTLWVTELGGDLISIHSDPRFGLFVVNATSMPESRSKSQLRRLNAKSGLVEFSVDLGENHGDFIGVSGKRVVVSDTNGALLGVDPSNGNSIWKLALGSRTIFAPALNESTIAIATAEKKIEIINSEDGKRRSSIETKRQITSLAIRENQMLIAGDERGNVTNYSDQNGNIFWHFKSGGRIGSITETDEGILVGSYDNFLYMISKYSGDVKWKRRLDGRIVHLPAISKSEIAATVSADKELVILDDGNGKILEQVLLGENSFPVSNPKIIVNSYLVVPVSTGLVAFSRSGCQ
ncbi:MAG: PQQ-binding-like beta-propeller repeat protein [Pyrinomonadaceae bacterium]